LQSNYTQPITRAEFTDLAVALYEAMTDVEITGRMNFNDSDHINVQKMGYLGVVTGVGGGNFNPDRTITREQAAAMLSRLVRAIQNNLLIIFPEIDMPYPSALFADYDRISSWAVNSVMWVRGHGIMLGLNDNAFAPQDTYTREQSIATVYRLMLFFSEWVR